MELIRILEYINTNRETLTANELWNKLRAALNEAVESHVPHRNASNRDRPPWINSKLKKLIKTRDRLVKKTKKGSKKSKLRTTKLQTLKSTIRKETRAAYWTYVESVITPNQDDSNRNGNKKLWYFIKHRRTDSVGIAPLKENVILKDTPLDKARILNAQFSSVFTKESPLNPPPQEAGLIRQYPPISKLNVTTEGIQQLENINPNKAMGPDRLHPRVLKETARAVAPIVHIIFSKPP